MARRHILRSLPGILATLLMVVAATAAAVTGTGSLFYEGWGQPVPYLLRYTAPALVLLALGLVALRWPAGGGVLLLLVALGAGAWWVLWQVGRGMAPLEILLVTALTMIAPLIGAALLFLFEARHRRCSQEEGALPSSRWLGRQWRSVLLVVMPSMGVAILSAQQLPALLARQDDGQRGARIVTGNGVTLMWAPQGPGWNGHLPGAPFPTWESLAHHGTASLERCAYLDEQGLTLLATPTRIWRMPTADEIVRSLTRNAQNAGCAWDGRSPHAACRTAPDKETPLWAPNQAPIYYWSAQTAGPTTAVAVNYTGGISALPRSAPDLGIGFRCVRRGPPSPIPARSQLLDRRWPVPVPEPATLILCGAGLAGLAGRAWRKRRG